MQIDLCNQKNADRDRECETYAEIIVGEVDTSNEGQDASKGCGVGRGGRSARGRDSTARLRHHRATCQTGASVAKRQLLSMLPHAKTATSPLLFPVKNVFDFFHFTF